MFNGFIKSCMLGSHIYYKNPFSAWQISSYDFLVETFKVHCFNNIRSPMDDLRFRLNFNLSNKNEIYHHS